MVRETVLQVRRHVTPAAIGAVLLLYFGFNHLAEPTGSDWFHRAAWVFFHTLRIGGVSMGVVVVGLAMGHPLALAFDALVAVVIGVLLVGTGVVMLLAGGEAAQSIINLVCGSGFVSSGVHSWREYAALRAVASPLVGDAEVRTRNVARSVSARHMAGDRKAPPSRGDATAPGGYLASFAKKPPPSGGQTPP